MTVISKLLAAASASTLVALAMPASAAPLLYTYTATSSTSLYSSFSFNTDSNPATTTNQSGSGFNTAITNYTRNGVVMPISTVYFYTTASAGGFNLESSFAPYSAQLFSGTVAAPTLLTGSFTIYSNSAQTTPIGTLAVTAVPEPATWGMMIVGLGAVGGAMRYRRRSTKVAFA